MTTTIWECKIGEVHSVAEGADYLMRQAVADAYKAQTGVEPVFIFSGWGASLTEAERAVVENRLPAPATAPEPVAWLAHYVGRSGVEQEYVSTDKTLADENDASGKARPLYLHPPATAPAWHDAPTVPGLWLCDEGDENPYRFTCHNVSIPLNPHLVGEGERWYGPIPEDRQ